VSPEIKPGETYRVRAEITRRAWRVVLRQPGQGDWSMPFWDTGAVPMDSLAGTRLVFADVEPDGGAGASRWAAIRIRRVPAVRP
jgi:hypothetical protein